MVFIPLPFVLTILLLILLVQLLRNREAGYGADVFFVALISAYMLQSVFLGLRWGYGITAILPLQIVLASMIAGLAYLSFYSLTQDDRGEGLNIKALWPHALPVLAVVLLVLIRRDLAALAIIAIFLAYGIALMRLSKAGPDVLIASRLDGALRSYRAMQITDLMLIGSVIVDTLINVDFLWSGGKYSPSIILVTNIVTLLLLGAAAGVALNSQPTDIETLPKDAQPSFASEPALNTDEQQALLIELDVLMQDKQLYKDMELNLSRIARRMRRPARHVSEAVNRCRGISVSLYVNNFRVAEACRLLRETDEPVTQITFASGFLTKSNFNREFLRVTGLSPIRWRNHSAQQNNADNKKLSA